MGLATQNGVDLAISQNPTLGSGYQLQSEFMNDVSPALGRHDPQKGAANVEALIADLSVMAIVGPFNSSVAAAEMPITNQASMTLLSPSNTNPGLTLQQYAAANGINWSQAHPAGKPDCYFRLPGNDLVQGTLLADLALQGKMGMRAYHSVYVLDDNEVYGVGLANFFSTEFTQKGGTVLRRDSITTTDSGTISSLAASIQAAHPDFVFYGGITFGGTTMLKADLGAGVVMEGGDGIADDPAWTQMAGAASANTFGTVAAPDTSTFTSGAAATFVAQYMAKYGSSPYPYSAMAYDATMIEIAAIKAVIASGTAPTPANVCAQVAKANYTGIIGHIAFNANGDNSGQKVFSLYQTSSNGATWNLKEEDIVTG